MRPADDYISDFIKDINRGRVINIGSLAERGRAAPDGVPLLQSATKLEAALLPLFKAPGQICGVVDKSGQPLGTLSLANAIEALNVNNA